MTKRLLIDGAHEEEVRVAIADDEKLEKFEFEILSKTQIKGNIYLGKIVRIEPSLQAAFVDYGGGRHGFLSFSEIHPNYYQIPVSDKEKLDSIVDGELKKIEEKRSANGEESFSEQDKESLAAKIRTQFYRKYTIQEVVKKRQVVLVQVTKEERGNKGAALTTYISLAGRYCILMPNTQRPCGISKKISSGAERKKIREMLNELGIPYDMCVVVRTAGLNRTKQELKRDFEYLYKIWNEIRDQVVRSQAPCLINEEAGIVKRAIRDMYSKEISEIIIEGEKSYKIAKNFMKRILPSHSKKVKLYEDSVVPLFSKFDINDQINQIYSTRVNLPSGGYLVINTTEALVAIDVNSGKAIKERNIGDTALKTNLEAAVEVVRQAKLRDLGGLIVVDFIDMNDPRHDNLIEKTVREAFRDDKAKTQVSEISVFGLLEISRQRLRPNLMETHRISCPYCSGTGTIWSTESMIVQALRKLEETCASADVKDVKITLSPQTAVYLLNHKRAFISSIEETRHCKILVAIDYDMSLADFSVEPMSYYNQYHDYDDKDELEETEELTETKRHTGNAHEFVKQKRRPSRSRKFSTKDYRSEESEVAANLDEKTENQEKPQYSTDERQKDRFRKTKVSYRVARRENYARSVINGNLENNDGEKLTVDADSAEKENTSVVKNMRNIRRKRPAVLSETSNVNEKQNDVEINDKGSSESENKLQKVELDERKKKRRFKPNPRLKKTGASVDNESSEQNNKNNDEEKKKTEKKEVANEKDERIGEIVNIVNTHIDKAFSKITSPELQANKFPAFEKLTMDGSYINALQDAFTVTRQVDENQDKILGAKNDGTISSEKESVKQKKGWWDKLLK